MTILLPAQPNTADAAHNLAMLAAFLLRLESSEGSDPNSDTVEGRECRAQPEDEFNRRFASQVARSSELRSKAERIWLRRPSDCQWDHPVMTYVLRAWDELLTINEQLASRLAESPDFPERFKRRFEKRIADEGTLIVARVRQIEPVDGLVA